MTSDDKREVIAQRLEALARDMRTHSERLRAALAGLEGATARHDKAWKSAMADINRILDSMDEENPDPESLEAIREQLSDLTAATTDYNLRLRDIRP